MGFEITPRTKLDIRRTLDMSGYLSRPILGRWVNEDDGREGSAELFRVVSTNHGEYVTVTCTIDYGSGPKATAMPRLRNLPPDVQEALIAAPYVQ